MEDAILEFWTHREKHKLCGVERPTRLDRLTRIVDVQLIDNALIAAPKHHHELLNVDSPVSVSWTRLGSCRARNFLPLERQWHRTVLLLHLLVWSRLPELKLQITAFSHYKLDFYFFFFCTKQRIFIFRRSRGDTFIFGFFAHFTARISLFAQLVLHQCTFTRFFVVFLAF